MHADLPKHVHFSLSSDDPVHAKRTYTFLEFHFKTIYVSQFDPTDQYLYQVTVPTVADPRFC